MVAICLMNYQVICQNPKKIEKYDFGTEHPGSAKIKSRRLAR
jgi:hypothetical protein